MIHQARTHTLVFAALIHGKILPNWRDFGDEFVTKDAPKENPWNVNATKLLHNKLNYVFKYLSNKDKDIINSTMLTKDFLSQDRTAIMAEPRVDFCGGKIK